jgi:hypothetical protein
MKIIQRFRVVLLAAALFSIGSPALEAAAFTFTDTLTRDNDIRLFSFNTTATAIVDLTTTSYAAGGFSPVLSLFNMQDSGLLIGRDNGIDHPSGDASLSLSLVPGQYVLALTVFDDLATGPRFSDGFLRDRDPNFTRQFGSPGNTGSFLNIDGQARTGRYSLVVNNVTAAAVSAVPEPGSLALIGLSAVCLLARSYRRRT